MLRKVGKDIRILGKFWEKIYGNFKEYIKKF